MYCLRCGQQLPLTAQFCSVCGEHAAAPERVRSLSPEEDDYKTKVITNPPATPRPKFSATPARIERKAGSVSRVLFGILIGMVLAGLGAIFVVWFSRDRIDTRTEQAQNPVVPAATTPASINIPTPTGTPTFGPSSTSPARSTDPYPLATLTRFIHPVFQVPHHRISFEFGQNGGVVRDQIPGWVRYYVVSGRAGQSMTVTLEAANDAGSFDIHVGDPEQTSLIDGARMSWAGTLPRTGDYLINVHRNVEKHGRGMPIKMIISIH